MRRMLKVTVWVAVFAACAGVGAFIASRTNPFPPGVSDPGAVSPAPSPTPTPSQAPAGVQWSGHVIATTRHELFVGGFCSTNWRLTLAFFVDDFGKVTGSGTAHLRGRLRCDFTTAQVQSRTLRLRISGRHANGRIALHLAVTERAPGGSDDYGGLIRTLPKFPSVKVHAGSMHETPSVVVSDGDQGHYVAGYQLALDCQDC
jgi:hypothetical protein